MVRFWMSRCVRHLVAAAACGLLFNLSAGPVGPVQAATTVSASFFYGPLAHHGHWVEHQRYGTVWYPRDREPGWRPYTHGQWVWTAEYGWYWESDEDWGWATDHYGRWVWAEEHGWVWVPGDVWGPAWVEWRHGGGYVGWAPLPPEVVWREDRFHYGSYDRSSPRYRSSWVFVTEREFASPAVHTLAAAAAENAALLDRTGTVTNYVRLKDAIANRSIDVRRVAKARGRDIKPVRVVESERPVPSAKLAAADAREPRQIAVYRPNLTARVEAIADAHLDPPTIGQVDTSVSTTLEGPGIRAAGSAAIGGAVVAPSIGLAPIGAPSLGGAVGGGLGLGR
jgi:hypothetical protein